MDDILVRVAREALAKAGRPTKVLAGRVAFPLDDNNDRVATGEVSETKAVI